MKKWILTLFTILWMSIIFSFSNSPGYESSDISDSFIDSTIINICKFFNNELDKNDEKEIISIVSFPVRKMAHFTEYLIFGILVFLTFKEYKISYYYLFAFLFCVFYASSDEIHQFFVYGRSCNVKDVMLDSLGSLTSITCLYKYFERGKL